MILDCVHQTSNDPEWDRSLMIKFTFTGDKMSIFSFNENQRHGEGSRLHPFTLNSSYSDNTTITPIEGHQYHLDFVHNISGTKLSTYEFVCKSRKFGVWEIQTFMKDHEIEGFRDAVNYPIECTNFGVLNQISNPIPIEVCRNCKQLRFH